MVENGDYKIDMEGRMSSIETKMDSVMENHLPHIDAKIEKLFGKMDKFTWLVISTLITVIIGLIMIFFKR